MESYSNINIETKKIQLKEWIGQYINKFEEKNISQSKIDKYKFLLTAIDFSLTNDSINKVNHLFDIRNKIEIHIKDNNFNKEYKKLLGKLDWNMNKLINQIYLVDLQTDVQSNIYRVAVFNREDIELYQNTL